MENGKNEDDYMTDKSIDFAETIKLMRTTAGFTQQELAKKLNMPHQTLSSYERNRNKPTLELLTKIANACEFNVTITDRNSDEKFVVVEKKQ